MAISSPPNRVASPPPPPPTPGLGGPFAILFLVAVFAVIAAVVYLNNGNPEIRRIDLVAQQYADAWSKGSLSDVDYDRLSGPNVDAGDGGKVEAAVQTIVRDLDVTGKGEIKPVKVEVDRGATRITDAARTLATTRLNVTWELQKSGLSQKGHEWTYAVDLTERQDGGRWRVVWTPQTVHPVIRAGLVLRVQRTLAPRAQVIGAGDTPLPPAGSPDLAKAVLGSIATRATQDQADLAPLRAAPSDTIGVAGLQDLYDARLAGNAAITVTAAPAKSGTGIVPNQVPLFVGPPETPTPLQLTLDARVQGWAEAALAGARGAATLVVARPSTGELLAVANSSGTADYGLGAQQPPGSVFGLASYLAMVRQGFTATSQVNCEQPFTFTGSGQMFRNAQGPTIDQVRLAAAIEGGCTTALARLSTAVPPADLQRAAWDLGIATPLTGDARTPGWLAVADQLGTPAFFGRTTADSGTDDTSGISPVLHAEDMTGEGKVLASPLAVTRMTATVATGRRQALRLITNPAPAQPDIPRALSPDESRQLQDIMAKAVTEGGGSAHALAGLPGSPVSAMATTAGYGTGRTDVRAAWVTGFRGDYAFTVLLPAAPVADGAGGALQIARAFLANVA